jgi:FSR family fosmidomycin resistance protein-like MFS transporter
MADLTIPAQIEAKPTESRGFQLGRVLTIISAHFTHDTYSAFLAPLLPSLIEKLSLTYTQAGSLSAITQLPSLLNPIIGYLDDKVNLRILIVLAPAVSATMMSLLGVAPSYSSLVMLLFIAGISIAAFHALAPAMIARSSGQSVGRGMSMLMAAGELGRTVGPLLASWGVLALTLHGMFPIAIPGWVVSLALYLRFRGIPVHVERQTGFLQLLPFARRLFLPLFAIMFFRSFLTTGLGVYLPTLLESEGASIWKAGSTLAIYQFAGVFGAILGGTISDKFGRKPILFTVTLLAPLSVLAFLNSSGWTTIPVLILAGLLTLSSQPIMLAIVQDHLPTHRSIGNGLFTMLSFICLSISAVGIGFMGDHLGLRQAFLWVSFIGIIASPLVFLIPRLPMKIPDHHDQHSSSDGLHG